MKYIAGPHGPGSRLSGANFSLSLSSLSLSLTHTQTQMQMHYGLPSFLL